jgi:hypothetical protein
MQKCKRTTIAGTQKPNHTQFHTQGHNQNITEIEIGLIVAALCNLGSGDGLHDGWQQRVRTFPLGNIAEATGMSGKEMTGPHCPRDATATVPRRISGQVCYIDRAGDQRSWEQDMQ